MSGEGIFCSGCGITLRPFMKACPRCGVAREEATPLQTQTAPAQTAPAQTAPAGEGPTTDSLTAALSAQAGAAAATQQKTDFIPHSAIRQQKISDKDSGFAPSRDMVFLSPNENTRRFPLFTRAQLMLIAIGIALLGLMLVIAYLLWRQQKNETTQKTAVPVVVLPSPVSGLPNPTPSPTPAEQALDDPTITEAVKAALLAYNPLGFSRYKIEVKDGVVTISGDAQHQPEKDGAENVTKLVAGVKSVINKLKVKPEAFNPTVIVNPAEARILDEAMRKQIQGEEQTKPDSSKQTTADQQREAERQRREIAATKLREEEIATRKAAEEKLKRETEDYERRQEELRRAEADRRARAEQARTDNNALRYGTIAWSGIVDGVDEIIFSGGSSSVRHLNGNPPREVRASFSASIPRSPVNVALITSSGRGNIQIIQQPSSSNGYATIVRIDDSGKGGERRYEFTLRWSLQ